jgi:hypothetical protein
MKRHQDLSIRKPEKLTTTRARMLNPVVVTNYLNDLDALLDKLDLKEKPDQIWNCDDTCTVDWKLMRDFINAIRFL